MHFLKIQTTYPIYLLLFQEYTLTDDTVLEEHYEDPRLTQMNLLGGRSGMLIKTDYYDMFLLKLAG